MTNATPTPEFKSLRIAVLTISDTRGEAEDVSGKRLVTALTEAGHALAETVSYTHLTLPTIYSV